MHTLTTCTALVNVKVCINVPYAVILCTYAYNVRIYIYNISICGAKWVFGKSAFSGYYNKGSRRVLTKSIPPSLFLWLVCLLVEGCSTWSPYVYVRVCIYTYTRNSPPPSPPQMCPPRRVAPTFCALRTRHNNAVYSYMVSRTCTLGVRTPHVKLFPYTHTHSYGARSPCTYTPRASRSICRSLLSVNNILITYNV